MQPARKAAIVATTKHKLFFMIFHPFRYLNLGEHLSHSARKRMSRRSAPVLPSSNLGLSGDKQRARCMLNNLFSNASHKQMFRASPSVRRDHDQIALLSLG